MDDAQLWADLTKLVQVHAGQEQAAAEQTARHLIAAVRRERDSVIGHQRRTWAPGDELPDPPPEHVVDLDGDLWEFLPGRGTYRLRALGNRKQTDVLLDVGGVRDWQQLLDSEGPLTEKPGIDWARVAANQ
ncbi:hypothetical protein ACIA49_38565 [Kribbella sp. NPDC051587]|uniref:hypothetical protein n=1 Tax=Kribbella sp. NPDC051587 TaxID=3364119 RepID=UPI0037A44DD0